jgi:signal transduction histidine kinase/CheY-like chemotaxis protein
VPLRVRGEVVGSLYLADPRAREFSHDEVEWAKLLAAIAGLAMENERLYRELRQAFSRVAAAQDWLIQTEKARALEAMAGGLAHEFNNILAIIIGKMQFVQEGVSDPRLRGDMKVVEDAAWRAAEVVRRLQRFAATRSTEELVRLDLNKVVEEAVALTRARWKDEAEAHGLKMEVAVNLAEVAPVFGSPAELREMLLNLIVNALDAMPHGGCLSLVTRRRGDRVELSVGDTGIGMSETVRRRLFDPFFTTRSPERSGLGLSVVRGIVTRHRGVIDVESREGGGTTFRISFPAARGAGPGLTGAGTSEAEPFRTPARILLIEDEEHILRTLEDVLGSAGHTVDAAKNGLEALDLFQRGSYDVVITDLSIPERSGLEVARAVKHLVPGTPVILMTGWTDLLDPMRVRDSGVDLMLPKPFLKEQILSVLVDALKLRQPPP